MSETCVETLARCSPVTDRNTMGEFSVFTLFDVEKLNSFVAAMSSKGRKFTWRIQCCKYLRG